MHQKYDAQFEMAQLQRRVAEATEENHTLARALLQERRQRELLESIIEFEARDFHLNS